MQPTREAAFEPGPGGRRLIGLARLMTSAFRGIDLQPLAEALIARAQADATDADALMDLSTVLFLQGLAPLAGAAQHEALKASRRYDIASGGAAPLRLLALMTAGDLMTNTPLPFLLEGAGVDLTMLYLLPGEPLPDSLPAHDAVIVAISQSDAGQPLLEALARWPLLAQAPVINRPERIVATSRERAHAMLAGAPGIVMPASARAARSELAQLAAGALAPADLLPEGRFPLIVRPVDSHAGHGLAQVEDSGALAAYLDGASAAEFVISRFVDYRRADGLFRKLRVVLVGGVPYCAHLAISSHWMIHYLNAGMAESQAKRDEEAAFMQAFAGVFAARHAEALAAIDHRFGLEYLVVDCAETRAGELLVFEVDSGAVVHAMDAPELFGYKAAAMDAIFAAFRGLLERSAGRAAD